jgi:glycosyltransferase involved in cell wall biosynthesis
MLRTPSGKSHVRKLRIFVPNSADEANTNAQSLTLKEIVARLPPDEFHVVMFTDGLADPRIASRPNTELVRWRRRGSTVYLLRRALFPVPDVYFYPRETLLEDAVLLLRQYLRLKTAVVAHMTLCLRPIDMRGTLRRTLLDADAVVGNSHYVTETVRVYRRDATTIFDGIDRRFYFPLGEDLMSRDQPEHRLTVLYAGSFQGRKRPELLVRQAVRRPEVLFELVGTGELLDGCRSLARQAGCGNIVFRGPLSPLELGDAMRHADVFFFPSVLEGHPQVLGQAAACGLPSVAMNIYHPDYVVNGTTGFLVGSDAELEQRLDELLDRPHLRHSMSRAAVAHAQRFDWDQIARQWAEVLRHAVASRQGTL